MAARISLDWQYVEFRAFGVSGWRALKNAVDLDEHPGLFSERAVYVIRIARPFAFQYGDRHSQWRTSAKGKLSSG